MDGAEVPAVHMVHGEEEGSVVLADVEDGDEVAVREARGDAGLFDEAAGKGRVFCEVGSMRLMTSCFCQPEAPCRRAR